MRLSLIHAGFWAFLIMVLSSTGYSGNPGDVSGDDLIGLEEAIHALQVASGLVPAISVTAPPRVNGGFPI